MAKELPKRSEVKIEDTWRTEDIYPTPADWEADIEKGQKLAEELAGYEGKLNTAENIFNALKLEEEIDYTANRLFGYASRVSDVDTGNAENQKLVMKIRTIYVRIAEKLSFIDPELLSLQDGEIEKFYSEKPELEHYRRSLNERLRFKAHTLNPEKEKIFLKRISDLKE